MSRRIWVSLTSSVLASALVLGCGDSESEAPTPGLTPPGSETAGSAGTGETTPPAAGGSSAQPAAGGTSSEAPNAGIDGAPISGAGQPGVGGATAGSAGGDAAGGATAGTATAGGAGGEAAGGAANPAVSPFPSSVTRPRIMIVGDSIAAGPGCYKRYLLAELNNNGYTNFDFVGEYTDDCGGGVMHSARSCSTAQQYTMPTFTLPNCTPAGPYPGMASLMAEHQPDLVMLQLGVNDVWNGMAIETILGSYSTLIQQARAENPNVVLAVAQIQKIEPRDAGGAATFARAQQLIEAVPAWAAAQSQPESPVFVADLWTNSEVAQTSDGVHPTDPGSMRMAQNWFAALRNILPAD